jgi:hypothetical protein
MRPSDRRNLLFAICISIAALGRLYMRPSTQRNLLFIICISMALLLLYVSWNTAGAQSPDPPPTVQPFEPTATPTGTATATPQPTATPTEIVISPRPTPTNTQRPRPTFEMTPVRSGSNAHLPIVWR